MTVLEILTSTKNIIVYPISEWEFVVESAEGYGELKVMELDEGVVNVKGVIPNHPIVDQTLATEDLPSVLQLF